MLHRLRARTEPGRPGTGRAGNQAARRRREPIRVNPRKEGAMAEQWILKGDYLENCNCQVSCPCTMSLQLTPSSTDGSCHVTLAFNITEGHYGGGALGGLGGVLLLKSPPG